MYVCVVSHWDGQTIPGIHRCSASGYIYGEYPSSIQGVSWNGQSICHRVCVVYPGICEVSQQLSTDTLLVCKYKTNWPPGCTNTFEEGCPLWTIHQHKLNNWK